MLKGLPASPSAYEEAVTLASNARFLSYSVSGLSPPLLFSSGCHKGLYSSLEQLIKFVDIHNISKIPTIWCQYIFFISINYTLILNLSILPTKDFVLSPY